MPENLHEASTGGSSLVFSDDLSGVRFRLTALELYSAEEVRAELDHDDDGPPAYGRWIPAEIEGDEAFVNAPGELIEELQRLEAEAGEVYEVTRAEKSGPSETDPIEVNLEQCDDDSQTRL